MSELDKLMQQAPSTLDRFRLDNKTTIIVGGNRGLGQAMAMALAAAGADVCIVARGKDGLKETADAPSKGAVNQLTHSLAIEWGPKGINVNGIAPVFTKTPMAVPILNDPVKREWVLSRIPMKRLGELEDLFGPVVFLASAA